MGTGVQLDGVVKGRISRLSALSRDGQWDLSELPWQSEPILPEGVPGDMYRDLVSQLYHAELFTIAVCERLHDALPIAEAQEFLRWQIIDERRHAEAYRRYAELCGGLTGPNGALAEVFHMALAWKGTPVALALCANVLLEGEALNQQQKRIDTLPCPLFKRINQRIIQDESRHHGFGMVLLEAAFPQVSVEERQTVAQWARGLWQGWERANKGRYESGAAGAAGLRTDSSELQARWAQVQSKLQARGIGL